MQSLDFNCVDLIYPDPPFGKNKTWQASKPYAITEIKQWFFKQSSHRAV